MKNGITKKEKKARHRLGTNGHIAGGSFGGSAPDGGGNYWGPERRGIPKGNPGRGGNGTALNPRVGQLFITSGDAEVCLAWLTVDDLADLISAMGVAREYLLQGCQGPYISDNGGRVWLCEPLLKP